MVGVIGIGVVANSSAMQWAGFLFLLFLCFSLAAWHSEKSDALSIEDARKYIDKLEARERKKQQDDATGRS